MLAKDFPVELTPAHAGSSDGLRVEFAHALRGLAALSVLFGHFFGVFWLAPEAVSALLKVPGITTEVPAFIGAFHFAPTIINYGSLGVAVFFLISGFVIPFSLSSLSSPAFLIARFFRIYPVYWLALGLSLAAIHLTHLIVAQAQATAYDAKHLVGQALLLRGWMWLPSIDGVSWTLEIEIFFYVAAAALGKSLLGHVGGRTIAIYSVATMLICLSGPSAIGVLAGMSLQNQIRYLVYALPFTIYMFMGTLFFLHMRGKIDASSLMLHGLLSGFCFAAAITANSETRNLSLASYSLAVAVFALFYFCRQSFRPNRLLTLLADISYPLYAVHAVVGYAVMYSLLATGHSVAVALAMALLAALALSWIIHCTVERVTMRAGKRWGRLVFPAHRAGTV